MLWNALVARPFSEETFSFIKNQDGILVSGLLEDGVDVLGALPHPFAEQFSTVDYFERFAHFVAYSFCHECFSCTWSSVEEDGQTLVVSLGKAPLTKQHSSNRENKRV